VAAFARALEVSAAAKKKATDASKEAEGPTSMEEDKE